MIRMIKWLCFAFLLNALFGAKAQAAIINSASCSSADVQSAVNLAVNGDTVNIKAGTCTWTTPVSISVAITLQGAGIDATIVIDNVPSASGPAIVISVPSGKSFRITGFTAQQQSGATTNAFLRVSGGSTQFRMDHIKFTNWNGTITGSEGLVLILNTFGVADHLTSIQPTDLFDWRDSMSYLGVGDNGDNSWAQPDAWGTSNAFYVEDSTFQTPPGATGLAGVGDCPYGGCRVVVRFNTLTNTNLSWHGTESGARLRGGRHGEIYNNVFTADNIGYPFVVYERGGTSLVYNNTLHGINGGFYNSLINMTLNRIGDTFVPWGYCDGSGPYDQNDGGATPTIYATGTASASSTTDNLVANGTPNWTPNQWAPTGAPYSIRNTTAGWGAEISSNGSNTIASMASVFSNPHTWASGNTFEIRRATACIDQPGRGAGVLLSGVTPSPVGWVNEVLSPTYEWRNTFDSPPVFGVIAPQSLRTITNRDYYNYTASFNGTSGVGSGLLSARPSTCTPSVAYWATDTNTLYKCSATNTWSIYYTAFTYPHPLTSGSAPPTNLHVTSVQ